MLSLLNVSQNLLRQALVARGITSSWVSIRTTSIHYYDAPGRGPGLPVLLVHGLGGSASGFFRTFAGLQQRFQRVLALDFPGHGFSELPSGGPLPLLEQFEILKEFSLQLLDGPSFVVGNSLGGAMAIQLSHAVPEKVKALGLVAPAGAKVSEERMAEVYRAMTVSSTREAFRLTQRIFHRAPLYYLLLSSELKKMYGSAVVRALFEEVSPALACLAPHLLSAISVPVLLLWGGSEKLLPYEGIEYFRAHLPLHAEISVVERFGHVPQVEHPRELVRRLVQFADAHVL